MQIDNKNNIEDQEFLWDYLQNIGKPIIMYGTGDGADKILAVMEQYGLKPACFTASGDFKIKPDFRGYQVLPFDEVERKYGDFVILVCFGAHQGEIVDRFVELSEKYEVFVPDTPVIGGGIYTEEYIEENQEKLDEVRKMFADDKSREVFDGWLAYRISGSLDILESIATPRAEILSLLKLKQDEFFIDAGAFKGDTIEEFFKCVGQDKSPDSLKFTKIIAIEPDIRNYTALRRKFYAYGKDIFVPLNAAAWSEDRQIGFVDKSGMAGFVTDSDISRKKVDGVKIDTLIKEGEKPTFIKIDVEGAEAEVLKGARNVITKNRPKMLVSLYHRTEDMFELPLLLHSFNPRYKFYLRKTRCIPGWEFELILM